jgi:D-hydroxyproline dehydrogenase subunit alpha
LPLHHDWSRFRAIATAVTSHERCRVRTETSVWALEHRGGRIVLQVVTGPADGVGRPAEELMPDALVLATGAHDLTLPFPGWDLPGVYTGGAAQARRLGAGPGQGAGRRRRRGGGLARVRAPP